MDNIYERKRCEINMADLSRLDELVDLVLDFLPIIILLAVVLFFIGLIFLVLPSKGKLLGRLRIDRKLIIAIPIFLLLLLGLGATTGQGATTAVGLNYSTSLSFGGTVMSLDVTGLTVDQEYTLWATGNSATINNVTFVASRSTHHIAVPVIDDSDGYTWNINTSTDGIATSSLTSVFVAPRGIDEFLPTALFFAIMVPIILIVIIVAVVKGFVGGGMRGG